MRQRLRGLARSIAARAAGMVRTFSGGQSRLCLGNVANQKAGRGRHPVHGDCALGQRLSREAIMLLILYVIALALTVGGVWALAWGIPMIVLERGWAWVISGSMYLTGGAIVFGLAMVVRALRQLPDMLEAGYAEEQAHAPAGEAADRKARSASSRAAPARPAAPKTDARPGVMPDALSPATPVTSAPAAAAKDADAIDAPAAAHGAAATTGAAPVAPPRRDAGSQAAGPAASAMTAAPPPQPARPEPKPAAPTVAATPAASRNLDNGSAVAAPAAPAAPKAAPVIPAAVEDRLNDLLRPGSLASTSRTAPGPGSDEDAAAPAAPARPALTRATPQPASASRPISAASALSSLKAPPMPPETPVRASAPPPVTAAGIAAGDAGVPGKATPPAVLPAVAPVDKPARAPVSPDRPALAQTVSHGPGHAPVSSAARPAAEAKPDLAARIGSLFSRRGGRADESGKGVSAGRSAEKLASDGGRLPPVFPERPAPRPAAAVPPEPAARPAAPAPAFPEMVRPDVAAPLTPARTAAGDVVFPTRPTSRPLAGGDAPATRAAVAPEVAKPAAAVAKPEPVDAATPVEPEGPPTVVGSYTAAGSLYVMYSDGSIEAQTDSGVVHFPSLDALKAHVAKGDKA